MPKRRISPAAAEETFFRQGQCVYPKCPLLLFSEQLAEELNAYFGGMMGHDRAFGIPGKSQRLSLWLPDREELQLLLPANCRKDYLLAPGAEINNGLARGRITKRTI